MHLIMIMIMIIIIIMIMIIIICDLVQALSRVHYALCS